MKLLEENDGSAIHLHDGESPVIELHQELHRVEGPRLQAGETFEMLRGISDSNIIRRELERDGLTTFQHQVRPGAVFQVMCFREGGSVRVEVRRVRGK